MIVWSTLRDSLEQQHINFEQAGVVMSPQQVFSHTLSGSFFSLSNKVSPELPITPDSPTDMMGGGVCAHPPPKEEWRWEGGVLLQPTNGRELWRMTWAGLRPGGGGKAGGGGICEDEEAEEGGTCCWDWLWLACDSICTRETLLMKRNFRHTSSVRIVFHLILKSRSFGCSLLRGCHSKWTSDILYFFPTEYPFWCKRESKLEPNLC